jgi:hypothetical protein
MPDSNPPENIMAPPSHPRLLFTPGDVPLLRQRIAAGTRSRRHMALAKQICQDLTNPSSPDYFDFRERKSAIWHHREGNFIIPHRILTLALVGSLAERPDWLQAAADALLTLVRERIAERGLGDYKTWRGGAQAHDAGKYYFMLALAYDLTWPILDDAARRDVLQHAHETLNIAASYFNDYRYLVENNQGARYLTGAIVLAHAVHGEITPLPHFAVNILNRQGHWLSKALRLNFDQRGAPREGHSYGLGSMLFFTLVAHIIARSGGPDHRSDPRIPGHADYCLYEMVYPKGWINPLNDSFDMHMGFSVYYAGVVHRNPACLWLWDQFCADASHPMSTLRAMTHERANLDLVPWTLLWPDDDSVQPQSPEACGYPLATHFRGRGLVVARSGFAHDSLHVSMFSGENPQHFHSQADQNQVTLTALGRQWLIDPGYSPIDPATGKQVSGRPSDAHNNVHIDGLGQISKDSPHGWPRGEIFSFVPSTNATPNATYVRGCAHEAYPPELAVTRAERHLLVTPTDLLWLDDYQLQDTREHDYTLTLHAPTGAEFQPIGHGRFLIQSPESPGSRLEIHTASPSQLTFKQGSFVNHPTLHISTRAARGRFALWLRPCRTTDPGNVSFQTIWSDDHVTLETSKAGIKSTHTFDTSKRSRFASPLTPT